MKCSCQKKETLQNLWMHFQIGLYLANNLSLTHIPITNQKKKKINTRNLHFKIKKKKKIQGTFFSFPFPFIFLETKQSKNLPDFQYYAAHLGTCFSCWRELQAWPRDLNSLFAALKTFFFKGWENPKILYSDGY